MATKMPSDWGQNLICEIDAFLICNNRRGLHVIGEECDHAGHSNQVVYFKVGIVPLHRFDDVRRDDRWQLHRSLDEIKGGPFFWREGGRVFFVKVKRLDAAVFAAKLLHAERCMGLAMLTIGCPHADHEEFPGLTDQKRVVVEHQPVHSKIRHRKGRGQNGRFKNLAALKASRRLLLNLLQGIEIRQSVGHL